MNCWNIYKEKVSEYNTNVIGNGYNIQRKDLFNYLTKLSYCL